jgi:hypothetical protein
MCASLFVEQHTINHKKPTCQDSIEDGNRTHKHKDHRDGDRFFEGQIFLGLS